jgi:hypothetical protein
MYSVPLSDRTALIRGDHRWSRLVLQAVADVDQGSCYVILMLETLDRGELGIVIEHSKNIPLVIIAGGGKGARNVRVEEFQDPGSGGVLTGRGGGPLRIGHDAGLTQSVRALLRLLKLISREWETANHVLADEEIHVVQAKVAQSGVPYLRGHSKETKDTGGGARVLRVRNGGSKSGTSLMVKDPGTVAAERQFVCELGCDLNRQI